MHISRSHSKFLGLATLTILGLAARSANAQVVVQFNSPITTVTSPAAAGNITLSGVLTNFNSTGVSIVNGDLPGTISDSSGDVIFVDFDPALTAPTIFGPNTSTPISLVTTSLGANQAPGFYNISSKGGLPTLILDFSDGEETNTNFAVNVVPAAPAPEPSSTAGLGLGVLGLAGLMLGARRRRAA